MADSRHIDKQPTTPRDVSANVILVLYV